MVLPQLLNFAKKRYYINLVISFAFFLLLMFFIVLSFSVITIFLYLILIIFLTIIISFLLYFSLKKVFHYHSKMIDIIDEMIQLTSSSAQLAVKNNSVAKI